MNSPQFVKLLPRSCPKRGKSVILYYIIRLFFFFVFIIFLIFFFIFRMETPVFWEIFHWIKISLYNLELHGVPLWTPPWWRSKDILIIWTWSSGKKCFQVPQNQIIMIGFMNKYGFTEHVIIVLLFIKYLERKILILFVPFFPRLAPPLPWRLSTSPSSMCGLTSPSTLLVRELAEFHSQSCAQKVRWSHWPVKTIRFLKSDFLSAAFLGLRIIWSFK